MCSGESAGGQASGRASSLEQVGDSESLVASGSSATSHGAGPGLQWQHSHGDGRRSGAGPGPANGIHQVYLDLGLFTAREMIKLQTRLRTSMYKLAPRPGITSSLKECFTQQLYMTGISLHNEWTIVRCLFPTELESSWLCLVPPSESLTPWPGQPTESDSGSRVDVHTSNGRMSKHSF
jgi:hypothetical protein